MKKIIISLTLVSTFTVFADCNARIESQRNLITQEQLDTCYQNAELIHHMTEMIPDKVESEKNVRLLDAYYIARNNCHGLSRVSRGLPLEPSEEERGELARTMRERF